MDNYLDLVDKVLKEGTVRTDRTGTGTIAIFGPQLEFDLRHGFPAVTTKKLNLRLVWTELLWMISGSTKLKPLLEQNNNIWNEWPFKKWLVDTGHEHILENPDSQEYKDAMYTFKENILGSAMFEEKYGDLGPVYGKQWREWQTYYFDGENYVADDWVDQLQNAITKIKENPHDRRILVTAWNPGELDDMALPPCHMFYQLYVEGDFLDIKVYQRSADVFLGLPFDLASYATLVGMIAELTGKRPRYMYYTLGDTHIYLNHVAQMQEQLRRRPYVLPDFTVNRHQREIKSIDDFTMDDFELTDYEHHPAISGKVSI